MGCRHQHETEHSETDTITSQDITWGLAHRVIIRNDDYLYCWYFWNAKNMNDGRALYKYFQPAPKIIDTFFAIDGLDDLREGNLFQIIQRTATGEMKSAAEHRKAISALRNEQIERDKFWTNDDLIYGKREYVEQIKSALKAIGESKSGHDRLCPTTYRQAKGLSNI